MTRKGFALFVLLAMVAGNAFAQVTTGTISGTVTDETNAVLPGVTINLKHIKTGEVRSATSDEEGRYRAPNLALGDYELAAVLAGFQTRVRTGVSLTMGREAVVDFTMALGDVSETITVSGEAPLVDTTTGNVGGLMDEEAIKTLPLSGRDFVQLALLEPSVMRINNTDQAISKGFGTRTSFAGSRPRQNVFLMDGTNVNNFTNFSVPGSVAGVILGVDTVREFQVLVGTYSAEYAGAGGTLSAVTKSGTNELHGTGFWFVRNDALDSKNFFDREKNDFSRNQYGGTVGGPIVRDRIFFFASYEGLRDRLGLTRFGTVPDENARRGLVPINGVPTTIVVDARIRPYLDTSPLPNGRNFGDGTAEFVWAGTEPTDQKYFVGKGDYRYGKANSIFVRYTHDTSETLKLGDLPTFVNNWTNTSKWMTAENRSVLSDRTFFVARLGYVGSDVFGDSIVAPGQEYPASLSLLPGKPMGTLGGNWVPSRDSGSPRINKGNSFQYTAQMQLERGKHSIRFGGDVTTHFLEFVGVSHIYGNYFFNSLANFLQARPNRLQMRQGTVEQPERNVRMIVGGFYLQDDFRITPRLTLNAGLRYEPYTVPTETNGLESTLKHPLDPAYTVGSPVMRNPSKNNWGPRLGFAWDVTGTGKLAIRGGAGVYHDILLPQLYRNVYSGAPPFSTVMNVDNPTNFPNVLADIARASAVVPNPDGWAFDATQPRIYQYNVQGEWQITGTLVLSAGYVGSRGHNQVRIMDGNTAIATIQADGTKFFPTTSVRRNQNFAGSWWRVTDAQSFYDGFRMKVTKRLGNGMSFGTSYSLGDAIDDSSTDVGQTDFQSNASLPQDPDDRGAHRGPSNFHIRHNFTANFSALIPSGNMSGVAKAVLGDWQVNGIVSLASGNPFTVLVGFDNARNRSRAFSQHPNLVAGYDENPILGGWEQYYDPLAFSLPLAGTYGDLGRNTLRAPGLALVDMSLIKQFAISAQRYELRIEAFNLLNRANFGLPEATIFDASGRVGSAGRIRNTNTSARQVQLGVKVIF